MRRETHQVVGDAFFRSKNTPRRNRRGSLQWLKENLFDIERKKTAQLRSFDSGGNEDAVPRDTAKRVGRDLTPRWS